jgi:hypothetical protein
MKAAPKPPKPPRPTTARSTCECRVGAFMAAGKDHVFRDHSATYDATLALAMTNTPK